MIAHPPEDPMAGTGALSIAWPEALLTAGGAAVAGYVMPRAAGARPIFAYYNPLTRRRESPLFNYFYLLRAARNLCAAVRALHAGGYVIGDVNESNILVSDSALVTLVDTDSFQVPEPETGAMFRCPVGKPEFTPPELLSATFASVDRKPEHDLFGLGVLLFMLLMEGTHPFSGVFAEQGDAPEVADRIRAGWFPYGKRQSPFSPPPLAPPVTLLPPALRGLFLRCFEEGHSHPESRPDAQTWQRELSDAEGALVTCTLNANHRYFAHLSGCPWCERRQLFGGRDPFPARDAVWRREHLSPAPRYRRARYTVEAAGAAATVSTSGAPPAAGVLPHPLVLQSPPVVIENAWAYFAMFIATIAAMAPLRLPGGFAAACVGAVGWRAARGLGGRGRWLAALSGGLGMFWIMLALFGAVVKRIGMPAGLRYLDASTGAISSVAYSPDGKLLAGGSDRIEADRIGGEVLLWSAGSGTVVRALPGAYSGDVAAVRFAPSGDALAVAVGGPMEPGKVDVWSMMTEMPLVRIAGRSQVIRSIDFSPDGDVLATGAEDGEVSLWNSHTGALLRSLSLAGQVAAVAFSPDGRYLADGLVGTPGSGVAGRVQVRSAATGSVIWSHAAHSTGALCATFTPDSSTLISGGYDGYVRVWSAQTGTPILSLDGGGAPVDAVACTLSGGLAAAGTTAGDVRIWRLSDGRLLNDLRDGGAPQDALAFSPDGHTLAVGGADGIIRLWTVN